MATEQHLEKTPVGYIQWRFQDGHDRDFPPIDNAYIIADFEQVNC
jgi:hypothetical protein